MTRSTFHTTLGLSAATAVLAISLPAMAQEDADSGEDIVVTAQRSNETQVIRGGSLGALGDKDAMDTPFAARTL